MDVLLVGSDTPVGFELQRQFAHWGRHEALPLTLSAGRFRSERQAKKAARRGRPEALVDLRIAALLADGAELQPIDIDRCHWLAKACEHSGILYFLLSSDRVFSGALQRPLREADPCDATDELGLALIDVERRVQEASPSSLVLRTGPLFAGTEDRLLSGVLTVLLQERRLTLDNSELFCPSAAVDIARVVAAILDQLSVGAEASGCFHYCSPDRTSRYGFAEVVLASASQYADLGDVELQALEEGAGPCARILDCARLRDSFAIKQQPWRSQINSSVKAFLGSLQQEEDDNGK